MSLARALRSERRFGVFWLGFSLSVLGDAVTRTTLLWYVFELTGSSVSLGWLSFCLTAPVVVGGLSAGWLLDHFDRRAIMLVDSLAKALLVAHSIIEEGAHLAGLSEPLPGGLACGRKEIAPACLGAAPGRGLASQALGQPGPLESFQRLGAAAKAHRGGL